ncbi:hypothetical protein GGE46_005269 [Rhizobium etli]|uniref:Transmembrane protein n=1 Tax=Rhizobium etli TaxID=29449 RepID=A0A7W6VE63_RHIET|nr:hypothetical protein [Rhizobium etli]MBB4538570.1 hypothetical protein [Rhizobium etli]
MGEEQDVSRRPIASRSSSWAIGLSAWPARTGVTLNSISLLSILFAGIGAALILFTSHPIAPSIIIAAGSLVTCVTGAITLSHSLERL